MATVLVSIKYSFCGCVLSLKVTIPNNNYAFIFQITNILRIEEERNQCSGRWIGQFRKIKCNEPFQAERDKSN